MLDYNEPSLDLSASATNLESHLSDVVALYSDDLMQRRQRLCDDLSYFEIKLLDLEQLDPLDFTGLVKIYNEHARHIRQLIEEFDINNKTS